MGGVIRDATSHAGMPFASACVTGTLHCYSTDGNGLWNNLSDGGAYAYSGVSVTFSAGGHNPLTLNMTEVAYYPDLGINGLWKVVELTRVPESSCCFVGETKVWMADGTTRRIDEVQPGDFVIGHDGRSNRVVGIERPTLAGRMLYSVNGGAPFVTAEHPFMTAAGWKSVDPAATASEQPELVVGRLALGDRLLLASRVRVMAMAGDPDGSEEASVELAERALSALRPHEDDPRMVVYNLKLEGGHTFIANGYLVHNKGSSH